MSDQKLFMLMRFQVMSFALTEAGKHLISDAYLYAWDDGVFPQMHSGAHWHRGYEDEFDVTPDMLSELSKLLDDKLLKKEKIPSAYDLEDIYDTRGGSTAWDRNKLISALRYLYLSNTFDPDFWSAIMVWAPSEAGNITGTFDRDRDIYFN
ncbi:hypothetical protein MKK68_03905 [Methylobacterium sp. E-016]|uniref:hypothetical protein n=1 Tax=Methylobacterium sp. E-016 TaxID=2836556 RepID=UPI001FB9D2BB|nr:hypothetical protein [Methylobacterium sp. E-016]MCJ2074796.1 hypothetical protein [Methylobacterium sp. E-016]